MFPARIDLQPLGEPTDAFLRAWTALMERECHRHAIWRSPFAVALEGSADPTYAFQIAAVWALNMVAGSYCFPRYVAALAARAESDAIRHGLLENAWDEAGGANHEARSHFWLAVRLSRLLGAGDAELATLVPLPAAQAYTDAHYEACGNGSFGEALGMICLIEEFTTPEFSLVLRAVARCWPQATQRPLEEFVLGGGAEYFTANIADDERHRHEMPRIVCAWLDRCGVDTRSPSVANGLHEIREGIQRSIDLRAAFFDGIITYVREGGTFSTLLVGDANAVAPPKRAQAR